VDGPVTGVRFQPREVLILVLVCLMGTVVAFPLRGDDIEGSAVLFWLAWALSMALLVRRGGFYRPSTAYLVLFGLFHGGLLLSVAVRGPDAFTAYDASWLYTGYTAEAVRLSVVGMVVFTLCAELSGGPGEPRTRPANAPVGRYAFVGLGVEFAGLVIFAGAVTRAGGLDVISGGYPVFLQANESNGLLGYGTLLIGMGAMLAIVSAGRARIAAWVGFGGYAAVAFLIGTRGAVLFLLLALLVVEARVGRRIRPLWTVLGLPCVLALIGLVRTTRLPDGAGASSGLWAVPFDAIAEMGHSLRPTVVVLDWHAFGDQFRYGLTLIAVPLRFVEGLTGWRGGPPLRDDRMFNVEVLDRTGPIGGSPVAEAYHNAGLIGVVLFFGIVGLALGWLERRPRDALGAVTVGIMLLPLLMQTRNSFAPVPVQLALGVLLLWLVRAAPRRARDRVPAAVGSP
jgi:oligosaccharide repeat unit polymerase